MSFWFLGFMVRPVRSWDGSMFWMRVWACTGERPESSPLRDGFISRRASILACETLDLDVESLEVEPVRAEVILERLDFFFFFFAVASEGLVVVSSFCPTCSGPDSFSDSDSMAACGGAPTGCDSAIVGEVWTFSMLIWLFNMWQESVPSAFEQYSLMYGCVACKHTSTSIPQCGGLEISMPSSTRWGEIPGPVKMKGHSP